MYTVGNLQLGDM